MTNEEQKAIFAKNFRYYVDRHEKDQKTIARELGYSYTTFNTWYRGRSIPNAAKIQTIADYFGIRKTDLLDDKAVRHEEELSDDDRLVILFRNALRDLDSEKKQMMIDGMDNIYKMLGYKPKEK